MMKIMITIVKNGPSHLPCQTLTIDGDKEKSSSSSIDERKKTLFYYDKLT
jgi:hypothetical protein